MKIERVIEATTDVVDTATQTTVGELIVISVMSILMLVGFIYVVYYATKWFIALIDKMIDNVYEEKIKVVPTIISDDYWKLLADMFRLDEYKYKKSKAYALKVRRAEKRR
jgi:hypothetical protein